MANQQNDEWRNLTFSQRAGEAPLPEALRAGELSTKFRNHIWRALKTTVDGCCLYDYLEGGYWGECFDSSEEGVFWETCFFDYHFHLLNMPHDEISDPDPATVRKWLKDLIFQAACHETITVLEHVLRSPKVPQHLVEKVTACFEMAPYCVDRSGEPVCIFPTTSEEMKAHVARSLANINQSELTGAKTHFRNSAQQLNNGDYAVSIRNSIDAVASAARKIDPDAAKDLGPALNSLERRGVIKHRALTAAFKKLYGYTSDEQGIRKPLIGQESADVGFDEAIFMYGACVSFVDYLVGKQRQLRARGDDE